MTLQDTPQRQQAVIIELLCRLVAPIGEYRVARGRSKGKRLKRRNRNKAKVQGNSKLLANSSMPDELRHITIGSNSTIKALESLCRGSRSGSTLPGRNSTEEPVQRAFHVEPAIVFVCRSSLPASLCTPLSLLVKEASSKSPDGQEIKLVELQTDSAAKLAGALGLPKVGILGVSNFPRASNLIQYTRQHLSGSNE